MTSSAQTHDNWLHEAAAREHAGNGKYDMSEHAQLAALTVPPRSVSQRSGSGI